jgi:DNA-binding GntR family transcriptional regulator
VDEIFSLRTALECLAAEWALRKNGLTEKDFAHLQSLVDGLERMIESSTSLPVSALLKADERFYGYICRHSRHSLLTRLWQQTVYRQHVLMSYLLRSGDLVEAAQVILSDHQSILSALRGGDLTEVKERHRIVNESRAHRTKKMLMESAHS